VPQPHCRIAAKHPSRAARLAKIALSKTAAPSLRPLQSVSHGRLRRPAHRSQRPPGRQIAIDATPRCPPRVPSLELSDAGPQCPLLDCEWAGIRNPSHNRKQPISNISFRSAPKPAVCALLPGHRRLIRRAIRMELRDGQRLGQMTRLHRRKVSITAHGACNPFCVVPLRVHRSNDVRRLGRGGLGLERTARPSRSRPRSSGKFSNAPTWRRNAATRHAGPRSDRGARRDMRDIGQRTPRPGRQSRRPARSRWG